jgi:hypothetical protein
VSQTTEELIAIALTYHAQDKGETGPERNQNPETERKREAHVRACAKYNDWMAMLQRLQQRFPDRKVENRSLFRQGPKTSVYDLAYSGRLSLPVRGAKEQYRYLGFMASIVVPCYVIYDCARLDRTGNVWDIRLQLAADELALATEVGRELEIAFPGYAPMPAEVGTAIVPGVRTSVKRPGEATVYDCLMSDEW